MSNKINFIQIRVDNGQYERIKINAKNKGFGSMSAYIRHAALEQDLLIQTKIIEIHNHLLGDEIGRKKFKKIA